MKFSIQIITRNIASRANILAILLSLLFLPHAAEAAISFDAASNTNATTVTIINWNHAVGAGSDRKLIVGIAVEENGGGGHENVVGVTYNATALTFAQGVTVATGNGYRQRVEIWYLDVDDSLAAGNYPIQVTFTGQIREVNAGAVSILGARAGAPEATATSTVNGNATISTSITTLTDGAWLIDVAGSGNAGNFTPGAGQTERWDRSAASATGASSTRATTTAGPTSMTQVHSTVSNRAAHVVIAVAPNAVAEYQLEQCNPVATVNDSSASGFNGTANGNFITSIATPARAGDPGTCRYGVFDGTDDYFSIGNQGGALEPTSTLSYLAWVRWDQLGAIEQNVITNGDVNRLLGVTGAGHAQGQGKAFFRLLIGGITRTVYSTSLINDGAWHHIGGTFNGRIMTIYVDGAADATLDVTTSGVPIAARVGYWIRRGADAFSEDPDGGEHLRIEFLDNTLTWVQIRQENGNGTPGEILNFTDNLPATALHANFQLRISQRNGSGADFDYWHVDDVLLEANYPALGWTTVFFDNFDDGSLGADWSVAGAGSAGVGNQTANSGAFSMFTRWDRVFVTSRVFDLGNAQAVTADAAAGDTRIGSGNGVNYFDGSIDEANIFDYALSAAQVTTALNAVHVCAAVCPNVDHYALTHSGNGVNCQAEPVTVSAHDASHVLVPPSAGTILTLSTSTGTGDWALVLGPGAFANGVANDGAATYTFTGAETGVDLTLKHTAPAVLPNVNISVTDGAFTETAGSALAAEDLPLPFAPSGFRITDGTNPVSIGTQIAGKESNAAPGAQTLYLQAIRTDTATGACVGVLASGSDVTVDMASQCNNPTTCIAGQQVRITNNAITTAIASNPNAAVATYTPVTLRFGASSQALFSFNYTDVGQISLHARYNIPLGGGSPSATNMLGSSNQFVVRPADFALSNIVRTSDSFANPAATGPGDPLFIGAGQPFTVTVTARNTLSNATPNYGNEIAPEGVRLTPNLVAPGGGANPAITNSPITGIEFGATGAVVDADGVATVTNLAWTEVGIITLTPGIGDSDYLGVGDVTGTTSGNVGRFTPDHYAVLAAPAPVINHACNATFTYARQPFAGTMTIQAQSAAPGNNPTTNFRNGYDSLNPVMPGGELTFQNSVTAAAYDDTLVTVVGAAGFSDAPTGQANLTLQFRWDMPEQNATNSTVQLTATTDEVTTVSGSPASIGTTNVRFGRLNVQNAFGSELLSLNVPMTAQTFASTSGYTTEAADGCTSIPLTSLSLTSAVETVTADNPIQVQPGVTTQAGPLNSPLTAGDAGLSFTAPGAGGDGYVDITVDLTAFPWLQFDWDTVAPGLEDPSGRATFGIYRGNRRQIYMREQF